MTDSEERAWDKVSDLEDKVKQLEAQIENLVYLHKEDINTIKLLNKQIEKMKRCEICKHYEWESCTYHSNWVKDCKENEMKLFELKEIKEK